MTPPTFYPVLTYRDPLKAIAWLERAFGFRQVMVVPGESGQGVAHAELAMDEGMIMLGGENAEMGWASPLGLPCVNQTVYAYVADPDAHHARAKAAGATIIRALQDTPYGSREYGARDPEGHLWFFGTYRPAVPAR